MKKRLNVLDFEVSSVSTGKDWGDCDYYTYELKVYKHVKINNIRLYEEVEEPETLKEYKELNSLTNKDVLDILLKN